MNFFRIAFHVCANFRHYRNIRDQSTWTSLSYVIKLVALLTAIVFLAFTPTVLDTIHQITRWADEKLPPFTITAGRVTATNSQPARVIAQDFLFVLDPTDKILTPETNYTFGLLINSGTLTFWAVNTNTTPALFRQQTQTLKGFPDGAVNGDYLRRLIRMFAWAGIPVIYLITILLVLLLVLSQAYIFALVGSLLERGQPNSLRLAQLLNIALHAITPAGILYVAYLAMRLEGVDLSLLYLIVYVVYLIGAGNACHDREPAKDRGEDELL